MSEKVVKIKMVDNKITVSSCGRKSKTFKFKDSESLREGINYAKWMHDTFLKFVGE